MSRTSRLPVDPEGFIRANTALEAPAMVPEFRLWLASEYVPIWQATESWLEEQNIDPPYWAFCWPGGQAVARYLLDNPATVAGKRVIDFAAGSGVSSMAAAKAGAASVIANDIDVLSLIAARLNAEANGLAIDTSSTDWLAAPGETPDADVVIAGDVCYEREMSAQALAWLRSQAARGRLVLLGDPGRNYFSAQGLEEQARYEIPTSLQLENRGMRETVVWRVLSCPHSPPLRGFREGEVPA
jgi:predicted nicotinamide N-methyase